MPRPVRQAATINWAQELGNAQTDQLSSLPKQSIWDGRLPLAGLQGRIVAQDTTRFAGWAVSTISNAPPSGPIFS